MGDKVQFVTLVFMLAFSKIGFCNYICNFV